jgi:hypothetical protein
MLQFLEHCRCERTESCTATPVTAKDPELSDGWRRALWREATVDDWRHPQIAILDRRTNVWGPGDEVEITFDRCGEEDPRDSLTRILAILERYEQHAHALADSDPWDLRQTDASTVTTEPQCRLPKPPVLDTYDIVEIHDNLEAARSGGWEVNGRFCFIPPSSFSIQAITKEKWRKGFAFPRARVGKHEGPVDFEGRIWAWHRDDKHLGHWDVQIGEGYTRITHDGHAIA